MPLAPVLPDLKAGDLFDYEGTASLPEGEWQGAAQLRDKKTLALVADLVVAIGQPVDGVADLSVSAPPTATKTWLAGKKSRICVFDILFRSAAGEQAHTDTIEVKIIPPVTVPA